MQNNEREATWEVLDGRKRPRRLDPAARSKQRPGHISAIAKSHDSLEAAGFQAQKPTCAEILPTPRRRFADKIRFL
jgi:hypothetical protein